VQVQLDPETREALRRRAFEEGKSASAVAREILQRALRSSAKPDSDTERRAKDLFPFIGIIKDDPESVAENHDDYLFGDDEP
jgi:plasmid stability protein